MGGLNMTSKGIKEQMISARQKYIELIKSELLGPGSEFNIPDKEHELISSNPINRYSVGILYPQGNQVNQDNDETDLRGENNEDDITENMDLVLKDEETIGTTSKRNRHYEYDETADENLDEEISLSAQYMPSSMGISFIVKGNSDVVRGSVSF